MAVNPKQQRFLLAQLTIGVLLTLFLTYISLAIADRVGTPEWVKYVFAPGYVLGMRYARGTGLLDTLGSFGRIAITANITYYGLIVFVVMRQINWPKSPGNPRHHFWMEP